MTLIEVLTTISVLTILSVGISGLYVQALKMYQRGQRETTSRDKAALALERIIPEIREAFNVDYPGPGLIMFTVPAKDADGNYQVNPTTKTLVSGSEVAIYQSDETGTFNAAGHHIWRATRPDDTAVWTKTGVLMDDVEDLSFTYAPSVDQLELVQVAITVGQGLAPGYFNRTEVAEVWIRNH
jgi:hypothetical protein